MRLFKRTADLIRERRIETVTLSDPLQFQLKNR